MKDGVAAAGPERTGVQGRQPKTRPGNSGGGGGGWGGGLHPRQHTTRVTLKASPRARKLTHSVASMSHNGEISHRQTTTREVNLNKFRSGDAAPTIPRVEEEGLAAPEVESESLRRTQPPGFIPLRETTASRCGLASEVTILTE